MRIIICGAGGTGEGIARQLSREPHDITVIDSDPQLTDKLLRQCDVRGMTGNACHPSILREAGVEDAEMVIAVTRTDEANMVICQIAHSLFEVPLKIARIRAGPYLNPAWSHLFTRDNLPIDLVISPEIEVAHSLLQQVETPGAFLSADFADGAIRLLGYRVLEKSPLRDTRIEKIGALFSDFSAHLMCVGRNETLVAPKKAGQLRTDDRLYWATPNDDLERLRKIMGVRTHRERHRVIIVGGGNVGLHLAHSLEPRKDVRVRLIERDKRRAELAAETLDRIVVLHGDGLDPDILEEAGVADSDVVLGLTDNDQTNLLIGAQAKHVGADKVLSLVSNPHLARLHERLGVDAVIDPRSVTLSQILLHMRKGRFVALQSLEDGAGEVIEGVAMETSPLVGKSLSDNILPDGIAAGALIRDGQPFSLDERIRPGDHVVLFAERAMIARLERLFRVSPAFF